MKAFLKKQVSNGNLWDLSKTLIVAVVVGLLTMYGTVGKLTVKFDMVYAQVSTLTDLVNKHITDYVIHAPHKR